MKIFMIFNSPKRVKCEDIWMFPMVVSHLFHVNICLIRTFAAHGYRIIKPYASDILAT